jgi:AcrR family transcriptional regulator
MSRVESRLIGEVERAQAPDNPKQRALLEAAARIIATHGPEAVSVRALAAEVGTSTMAVYTWYGSKANLMRAVFHEAFRRFGERLVGESRDGDPLVVLIRLGRAYREHALANPNLYVVMFGQNPALFEPSAADLVLAASTFEILVDAVSRCVDAGVLSCEPRSGAWQIWASVHGAMSLELLQNEPPGSDGLAVEAYRGLARTILIGLGADPAEYDRAFAEAAE